MNSGAKRTLRFAALSAAAGSLALACLTGCSDHGPTNLYSAGLFGRPQSGATLVLLRPQEFSLSTTAGVGPDQYVLYLKNTGPGATVGPVQATVTLTSPGCASLATYAGVSKSAQTVVFGSAGEVIAPGDVIQGTANDQAGPYRYSAQVQFPQACSNTATTFTYSATDPQGNLWTGTFTGTNL